MSMIERIKDRWKDLVALAGRSINMNGMLISFQDVEKLIALYDAVDAANEHVELEDIGAKYYTISVQSWDRIETALKAIKEAE